MKKLLVIDGNSILNRAFYGVRPLTNSAGLHTNAIFGMLSILHKQLSDLKPQYAAIAFDLPAPTFRHKEYAEYKAGRKKMPEELAVQLPYSKRLSEALGIHVLEKEGYEADDIIGTVSQMAEKADVQCFILTGDRDSLQLISDNTCVLLATNTETVRFDRTAFFEKYGIMPECFVDVKALMGDPSDNIPGVPGIGEKTAFKLISDYGNIDNVYANLDNAGLGKSARQKMEDGRELAYKSKFLATIVRNAPIGADLAQLETSGVNNGALYTLLSELEFSNHIKRLGLTPDMAKTPSAGAMEATLTKAPDSSVSVSKEPESAGSVAKKTLTPDIGDKSSSVHDVPAFDFSENVPGWTEADADALRGITEFGEALEELPVVDADISSLPGFRARLVSMVYDENTLWLCDGKTVQRFDFPDFPSLTSSVSDAGLSPILYDYKKCFKDFARAGSTLDCSGDVMLCAYILNPSRSGYALYDLCDIYLGGLSDRTPAGEVQAIFRLFRVFFTRLSGSALPIAQKIELPLAKVLADMELRGFALDVSALRGFSERLRETENDCISRIHMLAGKDFNVNSPKQLGQVLFDDLKLPAGKKTKTGYSTNAEILEKLKDAHPLVREVLEYREIAKLRATYADGLLAAADPAGRVHTSFNQTIAVTGRLSSTEPNLQNIPVRSELGRELRRFFVASAPDRCLIDADYSQIELRLLAHIAHDPVMTSAFISGEDIHAVTASQVFDVPLSEVTPEMRKRAKAVNFGIVYGISEFSLAGDLGISRREAAEYIHSYFEKYTGISEYLHAAVASAKALGYTQTIFGRVRQIPELTANKVPIRQFGERVAMNSPIQGSSADIIKLAMIRVHDALRADGLDAHLILQIHDELIVDSHYSCADRAAQILKHEMENVVHLSIPLTVDLSIANSWFECK